MSFDFSKFLKVNARDLAYGVIVTFLSAFLTAVYESLVGGGFSAIDWKACATVGVTAGLGYIIKNFFSNSKGEFAKPE